MKEIIVAIEQEIKFVKDSREGARQYRNGYVAALTSVADFLSRAEEEWSYRETDSPTVTRLLSFRALRFGNDYYPEDLALGTPLSMIERDTLDIALKVLRSDPDHSDFLKWWLREFGLRALSPEPNRRAPLFPDVPAPTTEAELDLLEAEVNRMYVTTGTQCRAR